MHQFINNKSKLVIIENADYDKYKKSLHYIREEVFIKELNVDPKKEVDGKDPDCFHTLIIYDGKPIATGRMKKCGYIGRVSVIKSYRKKGYGKIIMENLMKIAKENNMKRVDLGALAPSKKFYEKLGFKEYGEVYIVADVEHQKMKKLL